jgi:sarcosine oxidase subunit beta
MRYSALRLIREGLRGHRGWQPVWHDRAPADRYDVIIVGGGGHGLATAYYLAKTYGVTKVAVLEKGWIGGGNTGRNTTVVRTNYLYPQSSAFYNHSRRLYESLSRELNYNIMFRKSGLVTLVHDRHEADRLSRLCNAMRRAGAEAEMLSLEQVRRHVPIANYSSKARFPIIGGFRQTKAGVIRHDAVAWGYARAADRLGVHIVQNCEVTGFVRRNGAIAGVETNRGEILAERVALAAAGHSSVLAAKAGLSLPITSYALQAMVSEPIKRVLDPVVVSAASGIYVSQSDKGELVIGGGLDLFASYAQRGSLATTEATAAALIEMFPQVSRLKMMRQWAGIVDMTPDSSPILDKAPVPGLYLNCGWGTGGFKAIPAGGACFAHLLARDEPHELIRPFRLARFQTGALLDEAAAAGIAH